jgi:hypothetical protein
VKTQIKLTFTLESLKKLSLEAIENQITEKIIGNGEVNWFDDSENHAIFDIDSLSIEANNID